MSTYHSIETLQSALKVQYADNMKNLVPEMAPILSKAPLKAKIGKSYEQPVVLSFDQGFTCFGDADQNIDISTPISHNIKDASIKSTAYGARSWITKTAMARAASSPQAFITNTSYYIESLIKSFSHMLEGENWYGRSGLATGTVKAVSGATARLQVSAKEAAPFLFLGGENMLIDLFVSGVEKITMKITQLNMQSSDNGVTQDGGITIYMTTASGANIVAEIANDDVAVVFRKGYNPSDDGAKSHHGIKSILSSAAIFGIDGTAANSSLWKAVNTSANNQQLTYTLLSKHIAQGLARGLTGPLSAYVRSIAYRQLFPDVDTIGTQVAQAAQDKSRSRRVNSAEDAKKFVHGTKEVSLIVDSIEVKFQSSEFIKGGDCFLLDESAFCLVGSSKPEFGMPGSPDNFLLPVDGKNVYEVRVFADCSPFVEARNKHLLITDIAV